MEEKLHIIKHDYKITRSDRETNQGHKAACLWFTGLSGSGKSTIANLVEQELYNMGYSTYILDGDNVRKGLNKDLTFGAEHRVENIRRIGEVAKLMCDAGLVVLAAFVSPFKNDRQVVKDLIGDNFIEVFVDTPIEICEQRDVKGLYKKARNGEISNFTGISSPFEAPENADIHLKTDKYELAEAVQLVSEKVVPLLKI